MLDEVAIAITTGAAGNIIAYMLNNRVDALRVHVTRMFRHGTKLERSEALRALEDDAVALAQEKASKSDITSRWSDLFLSYLTAHPEAREDIEFFASSPVVNKATNIGSQNHYGSGPQIGGDYYGNITFNGKG